MKIVAISDTHLKHSSLILPKGDIIIHAGDMTRSGDEDEINQFLKWFGDLDYKKKILVAGNHDWGFELNPKVYQELCSHYGIDYLYNSGCKYKGIKIWGSPFQPEYRSFAFNKIRNGDELEECWSKIPKDVGILVTHCPPFGTLDRDKLNINTGCEILAETVKRINPPLHIFGHIHESRGVVIRDYKMPTTYCNATSLDRHQQPYPGKAFCFKWEKVLLGKSFGNDGTKTL